MNQAELRALDALLGEDVTAARDRQSQAFVAAAGDRAGRLIVCGAGNLGRKVAAGLRKLGTPPLAFADNNSQRWGIELEGVPILSPREAVARFAADSVFVPAIWGAG